MVGISRSGSPTHSCDHGSMLFMDSDVQEANHHAHCGEGTVGGGGKEEKDIDPMMVNKASFGSRAWY